MKDLKVKVDAQELKREIFGHMREWQNKALEALVAGKIRQFFLLIGRRGGKDHFVIRAMVFLLILNGGWRGQYCFPTLKMASEIINGLTDDGEPMLGFIPEKYISRREKQRHNELWFHNGSVLSWDGIEMKKGKNMRGKGNNIVAFSEYAFTDKAADIYAAVAGSFRQNQKQYIFIASTPNGRNNDFYNKYIQATKYTEYWHIAHATVEDYMEPEARVRYIEELRSQGLTEDDIQRELYASFEASCRGAILGDLLRNVILESHESLYCPGLPVHTAWDLGWTDNTVIWFFQHPNRDSNEYRVINSIFDCGKGMSEYATILSEMGNKYDYTYGIHGLPHDGNDHSGMAIETRASQLRKTLHQQGHQNIRISVIRKAEQGSVRSGSIDSRARMFLLNNRVRWCAETAAEFYALRGDYKRDVDTRELVRNTARHIGDAFRSMIDLIVTNPMVFNNVIKEENLEWILARNPIEQQHPVFPDSSEGAQAYV